MKVIAQSTEVMDSTYFERKMGIKVNSEPYINKNSAKTNNMEISGTKELVSPFINSISTELEPYSLKSNSSLLFPVSIPYNTALSTNKWLFTPYSYSFDSMVDGVIIKGFQGNFSFTDYLSANINIYLSKQHFGGVFTPYSYYLNGSLRTELLLQLTNIVHLKGEGQLSLREGIDPKAPSLMGGANYYGVGLQFKVTNKIGIGVGFTNNYYRGEWTKRTYLTPVGY